jgi:hypothetical protein
VYFSISVTGFALARGVNGNCNGLSGRMGEDQQNGSAKFVKAEILEVDRAFHCEIARVSVLRGRRRRVRF